MEPEIISRGPTVNETDCIDLVREVSYNEVTKVLKEMACHKAAGPDGYNVEFYKAVWPVIGGEVVNCIRNFFIQGTMPAAINSTFLALILKVKGACHPKDFRPISCCNINRKDYFFNRS
ncbi:hypothetical protein QQ045_032722 [Rhodiola kirilowii]